MPQWKPYVPVARRRQQAAQTVAMLEKKGHAVTPVAAYRGAITKTFWGKAWCENLERYSDFSNRLPRGRTYLRNGSVIDLKIQAGEVSARVMGSSLYHIQVRITAVAAAHWKGITRDCARSIDTLVELLQGELSSSVMERITRPGAGLFPSPHEISFSCSCPDSAAMCKHIAATLYGIGARLDTEPHLLFGLRNVDAQELIARASEADALPRKAPQASRILDSSKLADVFGIDVASFPQRDPLKPARRPTAKRRKKTSATRAADPSARRRPGRG
jgi:uncharacterized Zn finger protein